jgi:hypothetical protein
LEAYNIEGDSAFLLNAVNTKSQFYLIPRPEVETLGPNDPINLNGK